MTPPGPLGTSAARDIIDFRLERSRHEHFFGREDVLAELDRLVEKKPAGFVLVLGGPGMGKSAILSRWVELREQRGERTPHHFLRRNVNRWDEPDVVRSNLAARIEALYPVQRDKDAPPERRLEELLARVSDQVLGPKKKRLVLVLDGLDEASVRDEHDNPVARILPYRLPRGVVVVCASRPAYPHLGWIEQRDQMVRPALDLAHPDWANSNREVVTAYWDFTSKEVSPPLSQALMTAAVQGAQGNLLYSVKLFEWLESLPEAERQHPSIVTSLPQGLDALLDALWEQVQAVPDMASVFVRQGLGLLAVAREALPAYCVETVLGWPAGTADARLLRTTARQAIIEEPANWHGGRARYRLYHESFGELVREKMEGELSELHRRMVEHVAAWPPVRDGNAFLRGYALRHAIPHRVEAAHDQDGWWALKDLCFDVEYLLEAACEVGSLGLEKALSQAAERCSAEPVAGVLSELGRALTKESHWLHRTPSALPELLWNYLLTRGWLPERLRSEVYWPPRGRPLYRLFRPLQRVDRSLRVIPVESVICACKLSSDDRLLVCGLSDCSLRVWDLESGREVQRFVGHDGPVMCCAVLADGRLVSGSSDGTLRGWDFESGREVRRFVGHEGTVVCCATLADGRLVSGSGDRTLRVWDLEAGKTLAIVHGAYSFLDVAVSAEVLLAGDAAGNVWFLTDEPIEQDVGLGLGVRVGAVGHGAGWKARRERALTARVVEGVSASCHILFLASNPDAARLLLLGDELRSVQQDIDSSPHGRLFEVRLGAAPRLDDIRKALTSLPPTIVHFGGHGAGASGILFHDDTRGSRLVNSKALRDMFELVKGRVRLVVLSACFSAEQASAIVEVVDYVVGMTNAVDDGAACRFSPAFYRALASGHSVRAAVSWGRWAIEHGSGDEGKAPWRREAESFVSSGADSGGDERMPQLLVRPGVNADEIFFAPPPSS